MISNRNSYKLMRQSLFILSVTAILKVSTCLPVEKKNVTSEQNAYDEDSAKLAMYNMFGGGNPKFTPDGERLVEGDMVIVDETSSFTPRKASPDRSVYWPNGEVIYTFHESINPNERAVIESAMQHWQQHTCITFRPRTHTDYIFIRFRSDTQGCWSLVGRQADRIGQGQDVSIGAGCANLNVVVHEIGHVLGFFHEQSRSDRDQYIDIIFGNVLPGYAPQFRKENDVNYNIPYDLTSTMQYPQWAFSKEIFEKSTIVAKNPAYQRFLSKNYPLSFRDRQLANLMYSCTTSCGQESCQNGGYSRSSGNSLLGASQCSCDCPPNYTGSQCETPIRPDYYESLPCGGIMTKEGIIETPDYPLRTQPGMSCMWDIRAPAGKRVSIRFRGFEFAPRFTKAGTKVINKCFNETVEVRLKNANINDGYNYCGTDVLPGTIMRSDGPRAVIIITANDKMVGKGLSAKVRFVGDGGSEEEEEREDKPETLRPHIVSTEPTPFTLPAITTEKNILSTSLPILPPTQPPTSIVTISSLLDLYNQESKKTLPPVFPFMRNEIVDSI